MAIRLSVLISLAACGLAPMGAALRAEDLAALQMRQQQVREAVRKAHPAVVSVTDGIGAGSGVIVREDGLVLTAAHVVLDANRADRPSGAPPLQVILAGGRTVPVKVVGMNLDDDAAMLKIDEPGSVWPHLELGPADSLQRGEWCIAIGHPGGYDSARTAPVRIGRVLATSNKNVVTDCTVVGGDSGGPLLDLQGRVVGIHSSIGPSVAENRHVPIARFMNSWSRMERGDSWGRLAGMPGGGEVRRPWLGVTLDQEASQALVVMVSPGGPAQKAGLKVDDVIERIDGQVVRDAVDVSLMVLGSQAGAEMELEVLRNERRLTLKARLEPVRE